MKDIIIVFPKQEDAKNIKNLLIRQGFETAAVCTSGAQVLGYTNQFPDAIVICGYKLTDMHCMELREEMPPEWGMLLLASDRLLENCRGTGIVSIPMPLKVHDLIDTLSVMLRPNMRRKKSRVRRPKERTVQEQETIDKAKRILMERNHLSEEDAHRYIQKCSMDSGNSLVETAEMILCIMKM